MSTFKKISSWFGLIALLISIGYGFYFLHLRGMSLSVVTLIAIYSLNTLFVIAIFSQRRHSAAKLSWLIVMVLVPFFGHAIFLLFGRRFKGRIPHKVYVQSETFKYEETKENKNLKGAAVEIFKKQTAVSNRGTYDGDVNFFDNGNDAFTSMFKDMRDAKKFIYIHFYIIHPGEIYEEFKSIILQKAKEGVTVRFIVDDFGRWAMPWYEINELKQKGVQIEIFGKVTFPFIGSQNGYRTHRKMVIVDGKTVHTGGMNIGDEYANLDKKYGNWIDLQIKIAGKAVRSFSLLFIKDWKLLTEENLKIEETLNENEMGKSQITLIEDGPLVKEDIIHNSLVRWIYNAKKSIKITTPYFIPTDSIFAAIKSAAMSGVDVTIFLPGKADKKLVLLASRYWANELLEYGVKFREMNNMLIHSKIGMFDNEYAYTGTVNFDMRSLYSQFESITLMYGPAIKDVEKIFNEYDEMSNVLKRKDLFAGKIRNKFLRIIVSIFAPMM